MTCRRDAAMTSSLGGCSGGSTIGRKWQSSACWLSPLTASILTPDLGGVTWHVLSRDLATGACTTRKPSCVMYDVISSGTTSRGMSTCLFSSLDDVLSASFTSARRALTSSLPPSILTMTSLGWYPVTSNCHRQSIPAPSSSSAPSALMYWGWTDCRWTAAVLP